jgi:hypothetical protein
LKGKGELKEVRVGFHPGSMMGNATGVTVY